MLKRVLTRVDFPSPDSPMRVSVICGDSNSRTRTDNHDVEVEALADALAMPLVGQVGETDIAGQLSSHDITHVAGSGGGSLRVFGGHGLSGA